MVAAIKALNSILLVIWGQFELLRKSKIVCFETLSLPNINIKDFELHFGKYTEVYGNGL